MTYQGGRTTTLGYSGDNVRQQFTQKERDNETGLDYFLARYYSSTQGRFTSIDPENYQAMLDPTDPQSWNAYSYVNNNPLGRVDPDGRGFWDKLKNAFRYGHFVENDELAKLEQERREWLNQHYYERDARGNWRPFDSSQLSTQDVFDKYREVKVLYENKELHPLTDQEIKDAWTNVPIPMAAPTGGGGHQPASLTKSEQRKLGGLAKRAEERVADVIRSRGGTGANVREAGQWAQKTLGETAKAATNGDATAAKAIKIAKEAGRLGQKQ